MGQTTRPSMASSSGNAMKTRQLVSVYCPCGVCSYLCSGRCDGVKARGRERGKEMLGGEEIDSEMYLLRADWTRYRRHTSIHS